MNFSGILSLWDDLMDGFKFNPFVTWSTFKSFFNEVARKRSRPSHDLQYSHVNLLSRSYC